VSHEKDGLKEIVAKMEADGLTAPEVIAWLIDAFANSRAEVTRLKEVEDDAVRSGYAMGYTDCVDGETEDAETAVERYHEKAIEQR
jgi:hypothetical protein